MLAVGSDVKITPFIDVCKPVHYRVSELIGTGRCMKQHSDCDASGHFLWPGHEVWAKRHSFLTSAPGPPHLLQEKMLGTQWIRSWVGCWAPEPVRMFLFKTCRPSVGPTLPTQPTQHSTPWISGVLSLRVKQPKCEVDYSHPCREWL
jgi:hypothetical protein